MDKLIDGETYDLVLHNGDEVDAMVYDKEAKEFWGTWFVMERGVVRSERLKVALKDVYRADPVDIVEVD